MTSAAAAGNEVNDIIAEDPNVSPRGPWSPFGPRGEDALLKDDAFTCEGKLGACFRVSFNVPFCSFLRERTRKRIFFYFTEEDSHVHGTKNRRNAKHQHGKFQRSRETTKDKVSPRTRHYSGAEREEMETAIKHSPKKYIAPTLVSVE